MLKIKNFISIFLIIIPSLCLAMEVEKQTEEEAPWEEIELPWFVRDFTGPIEDFKQKVQGYLDRGVDINEMGKILHFTPLEFAAANNRLAQVKALIEMGADPKIGTPLMSASKFDPFDNDTYEIFSILLEHGANPLHELTTILSHIQGIPPFLALFSSKPIVGFDKPPTFKPEVQDRELRMKVYNLLKKASRKRELEETYSGILQAHKKKKMTKSQKDSFRLVSKDNQAFELTPEATQLSGVIKDFIQDLSPDAEKKMPINADNETIELLVTLMNYIQDHIEDQQEVMIPIKSMIKAPNGHLITKNLQIIVNEFLKNQKEKDFKKLLDVAFFLEMPGIENAIASVYVNNVAPSIQEWMQKKPQDKSQQEWLDEWVDNLKFAAKSINDLIKKHWYQKEARITEEFTLKDLIATTEDISPKDDSLVLTGYDLTSLDGLNDIPDIEKVKNLWLNENQLTWLPDDSFDRFANLKKLTFATNQLAALPAAIFKNLANLEELYLYENNLTTLPGTIFSSLVNLKTLSLRENQLSSLPNSLFNMNLNFIKLANNPITQEEKDAIEKALKEINPQITIY